MLDEHASFKKSFFFKQFIFFGRSFGHLFYENHPKVSIFVED